MIRNRSLATRVIWVALGVVGSLQAVTIGQVETFQSLTTEGWFAGGGPFGQVPAVPPAVVATGGPGGAGDAYLQIVAIGGGGPGSRLVAMNASQWAGNYTGVAGFALDLNNFGPNPLVVRFLFENPVAGPPTDEIVTNAGVTLPASSGWVHAFIPFSLGFTVLEGTVQGALSNTTLLRIIHAPVAGDAVPVVGVLGVDNIVATPEPGTWAMVGLVSLALVLRRRW